MRDVNRFLSSAEACHDKAWLRARHVPGGRPELLPDEGLWWLAAFLYVLSICDELSDVCTECGEPRPAMEPCSSSRTSRHTWERSDRFDGYLGWGSGAGI